MWQALTVSSRNNFKRSPGSAICTVFDFVVIITRARNCALGSEVCYLQLPRLVVLCITRPQRMHSRECGPLLHDKVAWSLSVDVGLTVCWLQPCALQKRPNRSRCHSIDRWKEDASWKKVGVEVTFFVYIYGSEKSCFEQKKNAWSRFALITV